MDNWLDLELWRERREQLLREAEVERFRNTTKARTEDGPPWHRRLLRSLGIGGDYQFRATLKDAVKARATTRSKCCEDV